MAKGPAFPKSGPWLRADSFKYRTLLRFELDMAVSLRQLDQALVSTILLGSWRN